MPHEPDGELLVELEGVDLALGGRVILDHVDLAIHAGEIVTLLGPNGAGKTTLARVVLGLARPDRGRVWRRPGLVVGYLPQRLPVDPVLPLTVSRLMALARPGARAEMMPALEEVGVPHLVDEDVAALSGGELQRVLLARALLRAPELLVLDEPTQGVDFAGEADLYARIAEISHRRRCGVFMISHDLHLVMAATDRVVCLNRHVCCSGRPEAVSHHPEYLALFGPRAAESIAVYAHDHDHSHDVAGQVVARPGRKRAAGNRAAGGGRE